MSLTRAAVKARVSRAFNYWRPAMGLESWAIDLRFDEAVNLATCTAKPSYEEATLRFNLVRMRAELPPTYGAVEELTLHEMVHCVLWRNSERDVSRVTRSLLRARDLGRGVS